MRAKPRYTFADFLYRNYVTIAFIRDVPETWNIKKMSLYHALIKNCDEKTISIVFFNEENQLIDTLITYDDINSDRIFVKLPVEV